MDNMSSTLCFSPTEGLNKNFLWESINDAKGALFGSIICHYLKHCWTRLALLKKFGHQWWIGTCDGVAFDDSSEFGHYLMCYKRVGRVYVECLAHWSYTAVRVGAHNQTLSELNAFLSVLRAEQNKNVKKLIIRSESQSAITIVMTIWDRDSVEFATLKQKVRSLVLLRWIHEAMSSLKELFCIHIVMDYLVDNLWKS
ncbi:hypothetical protein FRX31_004765 [Thalictrum thalictroides]|uniref:Uncharacterized protein n=1 Tax=Thalictrum thalictroides TaxID=46969 RepID=A0A7J6X9Q1_THATH|nr:hypothetical protein FRX31_004765 [Thalictrum thalictroides]